MAAWVRSKRTRLGQRIIHLQIQDEYVNVDSETELSENEDAGKNSTLEILASASLQKEKKVPSVQKRK